MLALDRLIIFDRKLTHKQKKDSHGPKGILALRNHWLAPLSENRENLSPPSVKLATCWPIVEEAEGEISFFPWDSELKTNKHKRSSSYPDILNSHLKGNKRRSFWGQI